MIQTSGQNEIGLPEERGCAAWERKFAGLPSVTE